VGSSDRFRCNPVYMQTFLCHNTVARLRIFGGGLLVVMACKGFCMGKNPANDASRDRALAEVRRRAQDISRDVRGEPGFAAFVSYALETVERIRADAARQARRHPEQDRCYSLLVCCIAEGVTDALEALGGS